MTLRCPLGPASKPRRTSAPIQAKIARGYALCAAILIASCSRDEGRPPSRGDDDNDTQTQDGSDRPRDGEPVLRDAAARDASVRDARVSVTDAGKPPTTRDGAAPDVGPVNELPPKPDSGTAGSVPGVTDTTLSALGTGVVEAFVNGVSVGESSAGGALLTASPKLAEGDNVIALRARGGDAAAYAIAQVRGPFGRLVSNDAWRAKAAAGAEATSASPAFAALDFDDSSWANVKVVTSKVASPFPSDSAAVPIWSDESADTVLFRLHVYIPAGLDADRPVGFGRSATGGKGGAVVRVTSASELMRELCRSKSGNNCSDDTPRIIELGSQVYDFTGSEGKARESGCNVKDCSGGVASEQILNRQNWCGTKPQFSVEYDTAGSTPLLVGSNKTVIGIGPGATLKGKGLTLRGGVHNVVIRNLTITGINPQVVWGGDALTIDDADNVWIDHNRFSLIGRQMIVTGFGKASRVTFSYNDLDGRTPYSGTCNGAHYWGLLLLGAADTLTFYGNWLHDISGRGPHAGGLMNATNSVQLVNNYFQRFPGHALEAYTDKTHLLLEGNQFEKVDQLMDPSATGGHVMFPVGSPSELCQGALGRACVPNAITPSASGKLPLDAAALGQLGKDALPSIVAPYDAGKVSRSVRHLAGPLL